MKKKIYMIIGILAVLFVLGAVVYRFANMPIRYFEGEVVNIEKEDNHLVFTLKENEETEHIVCVRPIKSVFYRNIKRDGYAHNIEVGDYISGNYYHDLFHKREYAEKIVVVDGE